MPTEEITIAEVLKQQNYDTAYMGKWHLGFSDNMTENNNKIDGRIGDEYE